MNTSSGRFRPALLLLYACTGFTGLLIEQGFERYLQLLVGATVTASSVVIFAYFLGFALGGLAIAELQKRRRIRRPLALYGALELMVGSAGILFTFMFHPLVERLAPLAAGFEGPLAKTAIRFVFGCAFVLPAAALMGASFPLIAQVLDAKALSRGTLWAKAYAGNLAGAVAASLLGPYAICPALGVRGAFWISFGVCAAVCACSLWWERTGSYERPAPAVADLGSHRSGRSAIGSDGRLLLAAAFGTGLVIFSLEVLWTHLISVVLGCSVYAFSAMLLMVLLGLLVGAFRTAADLKAARPTDYAEQFRKCALLLVVQFLMWGIAPLLFTFTPPPVFRNFASTETWKLIVAAALILPSSAALGKLFPSLLGSSVLTGDRSFLVGYMNAANAIGSEAGILLGLFVLIPMAGSEWSLKLIAVALAGASLVFAARSGRPALLRAAAAAALILAPLTFRHWDPFTMSSLPAVNFGSNRQSTAGGAGGGSEPASNPKMIFSHEGAQGGITTVIEQTKGDRSLRILFTNGKFQGDDNVQGQRDAQFGVGALSTLFVEHRDRALLIGLGTGHSAFALKELGYREIDVAEFSPGIIDAARTCFRHLNGGVLSDRHVRLLQEDGRNVLIGRAGGSYDLVTIEITSIWFAGATNVYSSEFYEQVRKRLRPGGVLQQWVQIHHISPVEIGSAIATARAVFPYVSFWYFGEQGFLIATSRPQEIEEAQRQRMAAALSSPALSASEPADRLVERMIASRVLSPEATDRIVKELKPPRNSDHNRLLEYSTPRYYSFDYDWPAHNLAFFESFQRKASTTAAALP